MKTNELVYPKNAYFAIFGESILPNIPPDATATLRYVMESLNQRDAGIFTAKFADGMTYREIGEIFGGMSAQNVRRIIEKMERKLRHPVRSKILLMGQEAYLYSMFAINENAIDQYKERISQLEKALQSQGEEIVKLREKMTNLALMNNPTENALDMGIEALGLPARLLNCLSRSGIQTIRDILSCKDMQRIRNLGASGIQEIQDCVAAFMETVKKFPDKGNTSI